MLSKSKKPEIFSVLKNKIWLKCQEKQTEPEWHKENQQTFRRFLDSPTGRKIEDFLLYNIIENAFKDKAVTPEVDGLRRAYVNVYENLLKMAGKL